MEDMSLLLQHVMAGTAGFSSSSGSKATHPSSTILVEAYTTAASEKTFAAGKKDLMLFAKLQQNVTVVAAANHQFKPNKPTVFPEIQHNMNGVQVAARWQ